MKKLFAVLLLTSLLVGGAAAQEDTSDLSGLEVQLLNLIEVIGDTFGTITDNVGTAGGAAISLILMAIAGFIGLWVTNDIGALFMMVMAMITSSVIGLLDPWIPVVLLVVSVFGWVYLRQGGE